MIGHSFISFTILVQNGSYPGINPVCFCEQYLQIGMLAPHKPILEPVEVSEKCSEILLTWGLNAGSVSYKLYDCGQEANSPSCGFLLCTNPI